MTPTTIRTIDALLGKPICFALTRLRRIGALLRPASPFSPAIPPKKILLIKMIEQGATVVAYRAIMRAVEMVGRENVYFWVFEENRFIIDLLDLVPRENVIVVRTSSAFRLFADLLGGVWRARRLGIDATVDMEFFSRASAILGFLTGAKRRVGLHRFTSEAPYRGDLMTHRMQHNPYLHTSVAYWLLIEALRADPRDLPLLKIPVPREDFTPPPFVPSPAEVTTVQATLNRLAGREVTGPIVLLNPNASEILPIPRKWDPERFIALGKRIAVEHPGATIAITGAPSEADSARAIAAAIGPDALCLAGHTTLRELIVLYTLADVLVTNDSGPGHFSALTGIASIVLFGPETPAVFGPLGRNTQVIWANLACSPCVNALNHRFSPCKNNVCMQSITVDDVMTHVSRRLREPRGQGRFKQIDPATSFSLPMLGSHGSS